MELINFIQRHTSLCITQISENSQLNKQENIMERIVLLDFIHRLVSQKIQYQHTIVRILQKENIIISTNVMSVKGKR
jgi:FKBP-type peptidyl-prolyl cis-trans isomerase 2